MANKVKELVESIEEENIFYLPHRAVIRDDKLTTRIRIMFYGSADAKGKLIPDLFSLLVKFINFQIPITADIQQAFL